LAQQIRISVVVEEVVLGAVVPVELLHGAGQAWALAGERSRQAVSRRDWYSSGETITTGSCPARVMTIS